MLKFAFVLFRGYYKKIDYNISDSDEEVDKIELDISDHPISPQDFFDAIDSLLDIPVKTMKVPTNIEDVILGENEQFPENEKQLEEESLESEDYSSLIADCASLLEEEDWQIVTKNEIRLKKWQEKKKKSPDIEESDGEEEKYNEMADDGQWPTTKHTSLINLL